MESKTDLKEIDIKNRACYYFDDTSNGKINFSDVLLDKKLYETISVYYIFHKTSTGPKPLRITFSKIDGLIMIVDVEVKPLLLFDYGLFDKICNKIKYLVSKISGITNTINHNFQRIRIDSYNSLPLQKILTFHNVIIPIKSVVNKNKRNYYNIFLEKSSYRDKSDIQYF